MWRGKKSDSSGSSGVGADYGVGIAANSVAPHNLELQVDILGKEVGEEFVDDVDDVIEDAVDNYRKHHDDIRNALGHRRPQSSPCWRFQGREGGRVTRRAALSGRLNVFIYSGLPFKKRITGYRVAIWISVFPKLLLGRQKSN